MKGGFEMKHLIKIPALIVLTSFFTLVRPVNSQYFDPCIDICLSPMTPTSEQIRCLERHNCGTLPTIPGPVLPIGPLPSSGRTSTSNQGCLNNCWTQYTGCNKACRFTPGGVPSGCMAQCDTQKNSCELGCR